MAIKFKDMAIKYKENVKAEKDRPLTDGELKRIKEVEDYIDAKILSQDDPRNDVHIELRIADFRNDLQNPNKYNPYSTISTGKMYKELKRRYDEAGWKFEERLDDGLDGPNMSGPDYLIISGKK